MLLGLEYFEAKFTEEHVGTAEQIVSLSTYHLLIQVESWVSFPGVKLNKQRSTIKALALQWNSWCDIQAEDATDLKVTAQWRASSSKGEKLMIMDSFNYDGSKMTRWAIGMYFNLHDHKAAWTLVHNEVPNKPLPSCVHCTEKILINCSHTRHAITFAFLAAKHPLYIRFLWSAWKSSQNWTNPVFLKLESRCTVTFTQGSQAFFKTGRPAVF